MLSFTISIKMNFSQFYNHARTLVFALIVLSAYPAARCQDPGFFLDEWQEKTASIPDYLLKSKPVGTPTVHVSADMQQVVSKVSPYIFGNNAVSWDGSMLDNPTVMTDIANLDPHVLRWPGGSLSDNYFWNVPYGQRPTDIPSSISPWFGTNSPNWQMSNDEYYQLQVIANSTGTIVVNYGYARYGTGPDPVAKAAHMAADWVRYDNGRTRFWEIGNENFGSWESGYQIDTTLNQDGQPEFISGHLYGQHCRVFIDSMRAAAAETGADIRIGVVAYDAEAVSWDPIASSWNEEMMQEVGDLADFLVVHSYFTPYNQNSTAAAILNSHGVPGTIMSVLVSDMAESGKPMIPVAMTEWNIFAIGSMQQVSYINGMLASLVLGEFIRNGYGLGTRWDLVNGWSNGDDHGTFSVGGEPGVDLYNPRPVFFYMFYFQKYFGDRMVESSVAGNNSVIAYASSFTSGEAGLVLINKSTSDEIVEVQMDNFEPGIRYYTYTLTGGTDNGEFSRKVIINGVSTTEAGGGPDNYASLRAYSYGLEGDIRVALPSRSVVYLLAEKKPAQLTYVSSKIDTNASVISTRFTDTVILPENPSGFEVLSGGSQPIAVTGIENDPVNPRQILIFLERDVLKNESVTLSYSGSGIIAPDSTSLAHFSGEPVNILLPNRVTFQVSNSASGAALESCQVTFNDETGFTDASGRVSFQAADGVYSLSAGMKHLEPVENRMIIISSDSLIRVELDSTQYRVDLIAVDSLSGSKLLNVEITIGSEVRKTDAAGLGSFALPAGSYEAVFTRQNYYARQAGFAIESDTSFSVRLKASHARVKFRVKSGIQVVPGVLVMVGEDSLITNAVGVCTFESVPVSVAFDYRVEKDLYYPAQGNLTVSGDTTVDLQITGSVAIVEFEVGSVSGTVQNAYAILEQDTAWIDEEGKCKFYQVSLNEQHAYRILGDNFPEYAGTFTPAGDTTIQVLVAVGNREMESRVPEFLVYPNPAGDRITIEGPVDGSGTLEIFDFSGKKLFHRVLNFPGTSVSLCLQLRPGIYILKFTTGISTFNSRLVVQ
jgi:hypothetical protein